VFDEKVSKNTWVRKALIGTGQKCIHDFLKNPLDLPDFTAISALTIQV
jgi:hypothetical protein